jgi:tetratricopeptide (TPR) repeat protein
VASKKDDRPEGQPAEEEALRRAMTSIAPLLRASLQRDQKRRRVRYLLGGGFAVLVITTAWILATAIPWSTDKDDHQGVEVSSRGANTTTLIAQVSAAADAAREGWKLWQSGNGVAAEEKFKAATELDAADANNWNGLGWSRMQQHNYPGAWEAFERCLQIDGKHPAGLNGAGQVKLQLGQFDVAERYLAKAAPRAPAARFGLARVQLLLGKYDAAARTLRQLTGKNAGELNPELLKMMRAAAKSRQLPPELKQQLEPRKLAGHDATDEPAASSDADPVAMNAQGWQLFQAGKPRPAELAFRAALAAKPDLLEAKNGLGFSLLNQNKGDQAKPIFEELVKANAKHLGFVNGLARSYELTGEPDKAIELWRTVDKADGPVTACTWGLARVLTDGGKYQEAIPIWERIVKASPGDAAAREMLERCRQEQAE